jgi:hypothetical protein
MFFTRRASSFLYLSALILLTSPRNAAAITHVRSDFNGDGVADKVIVRNESGVARWWILESGGAVETFTWGLFTSDFFLMGDYDGDGKTDATIWRKDNTAHSGTFWVRLSSGGSAATQWGTDGDRPIAGDYDGDGRADFAVVQTQGTHLVDYILLSATSTLKIEPWGLVNQDFQIEASDFDGDGKTDVAVGRLGNSGTPWLVFVKRSTDGGLSGIAFGSSDNDIISADDYTGDGKADLAGWRGFGAGTCGCWLIVDSTAGGLMSPYGQLFNFGIGSEFNADRDQPVSADFTGDGRADLAIFRPSTGTWWVLDVANGTITSTPWGAATDFALLRRFWQ